MARSRRGSSRRTTRWINDPAEATTITAGTSTQATMLAAGSSVVGTTVLRIVGNVRWHGVTVDTDTFFGFAILVAPASIDAADTDPLVIDLDWLYWHSDAAVQSAYDGVDSFVNFNFAFDVKGRRKISEGESLFFVMNSTGADVKAYPSLRTLVMNP